MNSRFQAALNRSPQAVPPIWFMRQAGRYHKHYQALRAKHSFMDLCKVPELAAETTFGPIQDFGFDVAILFSDLLFPLEALGLGLEYTDAGPKMGWHLKSVEDLKKLKPLDAAYEGLLFQGDAVRAVRERIPQDRSVIGFVGGPWTLFAYAVQGSHAGHLQEAKAKLALFPKFCEILVPLLQKNIELQLKSGAELVMIFDTAAGEISPLIYQTYVLPELKKLASLFPQKVAYYSKGTTWDHLDNSFLVQESPMAGLGFDHHYDLPKTFKRLNKGFIQGNFDQSLLFAETSDFQKLFKEYLKPFQNLSPEERAGWVCGLGHGVLPKTPESHVKWMVDYVRESFSK